MIQQKKVLINFRGPWKICAHVSRPETLGNFKKRASKMNSYLTFLLEIPGELESS